MREYPTKWSDDDFDQMSWHDNVVHGIRIRNPYEGYDFEFVLDLDYILEYAPTVEDFGAVIAPALLTFRSVRDLKFNFQLHFKQSLEINWIDRIEITTEPETKAGLRKWAFRIHVHHEQQDAITFVALGFSQELTKPPLRPEGLWLEDGER